jgi:adenylate cyclase
MPSPVDREPGSSELIRVRRAVLVVDVVESVRLMQAFESDVIDRWRRFLDEVVSLLLPLHGGRLVKSLGDGMLVEFETARPAATVAFEMHRRMQRYNKGRAPQAEIRLRAGLHTSDVVIDRLDIFGPGVNIAARIATLAAPGEVVATVQVRDELVRGVDAEFEDLGELFVKGLDQSIHCWKLSPPSGAVWAAASQAPPAVSTTNVVVPRLAVMPLSTLGLQGDEASAGHLVADNVNLRLSRSTALRVISRLSSTALSERNLTAVEIARQLGVQYVVGGSVTRQGHARWRLCVELADGGDGALIWSRTDTVDPQALLEPDDDYSAELASGLLEAVASHQVQRMATHSLPSLQSYSLQLAGLRLMHRAALGDFERARSVLETLVERHPTAPVPRAWMSQWWVLRTTRGLATSPRDEAAQALSHTRSALQTDPHCALALATQGFIECHMQRDLDAAEVTLDRAIACNGNEALAWLYRSVVHGFRGQGEDAYRSAETATSLSPVDPQRHYFDALTASAAITAHRLERGLELARRALQVNRNHLPTLRALIVALVETGDIQAALPIGQRVMELNASFTIKGYVRDAPKGSEATRLRFAEAFALAGLPAG